jgi:catechol 2,3-dioxygenase-like lactoylglutathione lyase family enzyme
MITGLDHLQISFPQGRLDEALAFYVGQLGFTRVPKPAAFQASGGAWLVQGGFNLHLGEEDNFATDGRAHPAFRIDNLMPLIDQLEHAKFRVRRDEGPTGYLRASVWDPFGNRIEFMQRVS